MQMAGPTSDMVAPALYIFPALYTFVILCPALAALQGSMEVSPLIELLSVL